MPFARPPRFIFCLAVCAALIACGTATADSDRLVDHLDRSWIENATWYEGEAEVNAYEATLEKYGAAREAERVIHILVTEGHDPEMLVKADDWRRDDLVPMLKFNSVVSVRTGIYHYQQMLSFFFDRRDLGLAKMTLASHEWCGNTFKQLVNHDGRSTYDFNTYWDGQGDGSFEVDFPEDLVIYEALPVAVRPLRFAEGLTVETPLLGPQRSSQATRPVIEKATVRVGAVETIEVPFGRGRAWPVTVEHAGGSDALWFEADFPHRLLRWEQAGGDRFELSASDRLAYWQLTGPGDETAFPN
ncbi:MAG: hypothetical protein AAGN46_09340 [Acidobacteriota bacterium]